MTYENCKNSIKLSQVFINFVHFSQFSVPRGAPSMHGPNPVTPSNAFCIICTLYFPPLPTALIINVTNSLYSLF